MGCAKAASQRDHEFIPFYYLSIYNILFLLTIVCILVGLIICWINAGFLIFLAYLGIAVGIIFIGQFTIMHILIAIFGYGGIGALMPPLLSIISAIWMFTQVGSF